MVRQLMSGGSRLTELVVRSGRGKSRREAGVLLQEGSGVVVQRLALVQVLLQQQPRRLALGWQGWQGGRRGRVVLV